ncbi:RHS repeat-associated core domain-containing protein, partial [Kribbella turkmenica]|uniref:RHS repeat-associated core domain-containing protein n=1 Tax=Kribbella turkmenica TaxID=2530375 RepID=UPI001404DA84
LTTSTYRYTAYGQPDRVGTTGDDAITGTPGQDADVVNPYRFNSKRFNGATGTYDMGFREYNPALNRFLSRDYYDGALKDLALGSDPWNTNRYAFAGGNPITGIELDGHCAMADEGGCDTNANYTGPIQPQSAATSSTTRVPNNVGQEINESMGLPAGASTQQQAIRMSQLGINPTIAGLKLGAEEADRAGVDEAIELMADVTGIKDAADCGYEHTAKACGMTGLMLFPFARLGKLAKSLVALKHADEAAATVMSRVVATQGARDVGSALPKSFNLTRSAGGSVWVAPNATKHLWEETRGLTFGRQLAEQQRLTGLADAVDSAVVGRWGQMQVSQGWELIFSAPRSPELNPVLKHARYLGGFK